MNRYRIVFSPTPASRTGMTSATRAWWRGLPAGWRSTHWVTVLCGIVIVGLLMSFHQVVQSAVAQGALLRMNAATHAQATWRCHALQGQRMRESCMNQLDSPPIVSVGTISSKTERLTLAQR